MSRAVVHMYCVLQSSNGKNDDRFYQIFSRNIILSFKSDCFYLWIIEALILSDFIQPQLGHNVAKCLLVCRARNKV